MGKSSINGPFSMALLNNQRVYCVFHSGGSNTNWNNYLVICILLSIWSRIHIRGYSVLKKTCMIMYESLCICMMLCMHTPTATYIYILYTYIIVRKHNRPM